MTKKRRTTPLADALLEAQTSTEILSTMARGIWRNDGMSGQAPSFSGAELAEALHANLIETENILRANERLNALPLLRAACTGGFQLSIPKDGASNEQPQADIRPELEILWHVVGAQDDRESLEGLHARWAELMPPRPPHPFIPLVRGWLERPVEVVPEVRKDRRIVPVITAGETNAARLRGLQLGRVIRETDAKLPLFPKDNACPRAPIIELVDNAGFPIKSRGRGAALALRFAVRTVLAVSPRDRRNNLVRIALTVKELRDGLFPHGWERKRDWQRLRKAMLDARDYGILVDGGRNIWFPWFVRQLPSLEEPRLEDLVVIDLALPSGSSTGPIIDLPTLDDLGVNSSPRYRAYIAAHSIAWIQGITRVPNPQSKRWNWSREISRYPLLTRQDRRRLAFSERDEGNRTREQVDAAFKQLPGLVVMDEHAVDAETSRRGWRILPMDAANAVKRSTRGKN